jgi:hypothetical protein
MGAVRHSLLILLVLTAGGTDLPNFHTKHDILAVPPGVSGFTT